MPKRAAHLFTLLGLVLAATLTVGASTAGADTGPRITSPEIGTSVFTTADHPLTVDFTGVAAGTFRLQVDCSTAARVAEGTETWDGSAQPVRTLSLPALTGPDTCTGAVIDTSTQQPLITSTFFVEPPALRFAGASASATTFYPTVVDGYADSVSVSWTQNVPAGVALTVTSSSGHVVRSVSYAALSAGRHTSTWNGRDNRGLVLPVGAYTIRVAGGSASFTKTVRVATGYRYLTRTVNRSGEVSAVSHRGTCYTTRSRATHTTGLDCWGGSYGRATYTFGIPASTYRVSYAVSGRLADADLCCEGRVTRVGGRTSATTFRVTVTATGWRAYDISAVRLSFSYKARV